MIASVFVFRNGKFIPGDPLNLDSHPDGNTSLEKLGYHLSQEVGCAAGLHYDLWEHENRGWIIHFSTACRFCAVVVEEWPDLIELLGKLSTIALAGVLIDQDDDGRECPVHMPVAAVKPYRKR